MAQTHNRHGETGKDLSSAEVLKRLAKEISDGDAQTMFAVGAAIRAMTRCIPDFDYKRFRKEIARLRRMPFTSKSQKAFWSLLMDLD